MVYATQELRDEHEDLKIILSVLERISYHLQTGKTINLDHLDHILHYLTTFTDECHQRKEESLLFPALIRAGIPKEGGPIAVKLTEHTQGRTLTKEMTGELSCLHTGDAEARQLFAAAALNYAELLQLHIEKENQVLFVLAEQRLTPVEHARLIEGFAILEWERIGEGVQQQFQTKLHQFRDYYLPSYD